MILPFVVDTILFNCMHENLHNHRILTPKTPMSCSVDFSNVESLATIKKRDDTNKHLRRPMKDKPFINGKLRL